MAKGAPPPFMNKGSGKAKGKNPFAKGKAPAFGKAGAATAPAGPMPFKKGGKV